jgi:NAD(P)-dependent dehydrogenase (short-subunit alcohol dehydrogenase family)
MFAVLTGCTRGLGLAMVEKFSESGATVAGCGRSQKQIEALRKKFDAPHRFDAVDVANDENVRLWAESVIASHGAPDFLINNAALINANAPLWKISAAEFSRVIDVNIKGIAATIRHFVPAMIARGSGVIVNFSSGWGRSTAPEVAPYCATKYAVEGLTQAFAQELPRGLVAVALNPGIIDTEMLRSCFGGGASGYPSPEEWAARAVPFILKLRAKDNGGSLTVPGGATEEFFCPALVNERMLASCGGAGQRFRVAAQLQRVNFSSHENQITRRFRAGVRRLFFHHATSRRRCAAEGLHALGFG